MSINTHRPQWWESIEIYDRLEWSFPYNGLTRCEVVVLAIMNSSNTKKPTKFIGDMQTLIWLANHLHVGYRYQETKADGKCGIWAIERSLRPIYKSKCRMAPSFHRLYILSQSPKVKALIVEGREETGAVSEVPSPGATWLEHYQISATLRVLGQEDGFEFGVGLVAVAGVDSYTVSIDTAFRSKDSLEAARPWDGIVWLHNHGGIHWSGIAPSSHAERFNHPINIEVTKQLRFVAPNVIIEDQTRAPKVLTKNQTQTPRKSSHGLQNIIPQATWKFERIRMPSGKKGQEGFGPDEMRSSARRPPSRKANSPAKSKQIPSDSNANLNSSRSKRFSPDQPYYSPMDVDDINSPAVIELTSNEKMMLRGKGIPENLEFRRVGDSVIMSMKLSDWEDADWSMPLYSDVAGSIPEGHKRLDETDPELGPWSHSEKQRRVDEAVKKTAWPIMNAPSSCEDLPWDEINDISIEEFILYFPNHAARWPGIALYIRHQNWDRLFYRMARIINLGRGTHNQPNPDIASTQVLPLKMKMQHAIRQLNPHYDIDDMPSVDNEYLLKNMKVKPLDFPKNPKMVSLVEADNHVAEWTNEFDHLPFSIKMKKNRLRNQQQAAQEIMKRFPFRKFDVNGNEWNPDTKAYPNSGWDVSMSLAPSSPPSSQKPSTSKSSRPFADELEESPTFSPPPPVHSPPPHAHRHPPPAYNPPPSVLRVCNYDRRCARTDCKFAHHGPATSDKVKIDTNNAMCKYGLSCNKSSCNRPHPSSGGASKENQRDKQDRGGKKGANGKTGNINQGNMYPQNGKGGTGSENKYESPQRSNQGNNNQGRGDRKGVNNNSRNVTQENAGSQNGEGGKGSGKKHESPQRAQGNDSQGRGDSRKQKQGNPGQAKGAPNSGGDHTKMKKRKEARPRKDEKEK